MTVHEYIRPIYSNYNTIRVYEVNACLVVALLAVTNSKWATSYITFPSRVRSLTASPQFIYIYINCIVNSFDLSYVWGKGCCSRPLFSPTIDNSLLRRVRFCCLFELNRQTTYNTQSHITGCWWRHNNCNNIADDTSDECCVHLFSASVCIVVCRLYYVTGAMACKFARNSCGSLHQTNNNPIYEYFRLPHANEMASTVIFNGRMDMSTL